MNSDYDKLRALISNILDSPASGCNISMKTLQFMDIKPSGVDLKRSGESTCIDMKSLKWFPKKPSMEYKFHLKLNKLVLHYHPIYVNVHLCSKNFDYDTDKFTFKVIDYCQPGEALEAVIDDSVEVFFLKNHGVIIHADTFERVEEIYTTIKGHFMTMSFRGFFSPDEVILETNDEIFLHHYAILGLMTSLGLSPDYLSYKDILKLKNCEDEKYRMELK